MNKFKVGDFVLASKKHGYDSPHYEWCTGLNFPVEYAVITEVVEVVNSEERFCVKFIDGSEDFLRAVDIRSAIDDGKFPASGEPGENNES